MFQEFQEINSHHVTCVLVTKHKQLYKPFRNTNVKCECSVSTDNQVLCRQNPHLYSLGEHLIQHHADPTVTFLSWFFFSAFVLCLHMNKSPDSFSFLFHCVGPSVRVAFSICQVSIITHSFIRLCRYAVLAYACFTCC